MMEALLERASDVARAAQRDRLAQIAASLGRQGVAVEVGAEAVAIRGRRLVRRWLADPLLRFAGRTRA
jgi:5-enolpyruvylshikimate-3-phosphate synthase